MFSVKSPCHSGGGYARLMANPNERQHSMSDTDQHDKILSYAKRHGEEMHIDLWYPRLEASPVKSLVIGLMDVRAADEIRVSYDFERDGWKIEQASTFSWEASDDVCDRDWQEIAFAPAWGREKPSTEEAS